MIKNIKEMSTDANRGESGLTEFYQNKSKIAFNVTGCGDGVDIIEHIISVTTFFNVGDVVKVTAAYSRTFKITQGSVTIVYMVLNTLGEERYQ